MSVSFISRADGTTEVVLKDEPAFCHALQEAPSQIEPELTQGLWLVFQFLPWSVPDIRCISTAISVVKKLDGKVQLGIRPFSNHSETQVWCQDARTEYASPVWLFIRNGELLEEKARALSEEEIFEIIDKYIS